MKMRVKISPRQLYEVLAKRKTTLTILAILFTFPIVTPSRYSMDVLASVFIFALFAMSYDLLLGYTGVVSFGHAALFGIGAYFSAWILGGPFTISVPLLPLVTIPPSFPLAILLAMLFGALLGLIMGIFTLRVREIYYALVTLAFAEVIHAVFSSRWMVELSGGETGLSVPRPDFVRSASFLYFALAISIVILIVLYATAVRDLIRKDSRGGTKILYLVLMIAFLALLIYATPQTLHVLSEGSLRERKIMITVTNVYYFFALIPLTICYIVINRMVNSPMGRIFVAIRENEERAKMLGYNVFKYKLMSSSVSGIFASLAGALYAPFLLSINPASVLGATVTINVLLYSILGGLGTLIGPMIGAGIITLFTSGLGSYMPGELLLLALGVFYVLVILFLPYGIVITWKIKGTSARRMLKRMARSIKISGRKKHTAKESAS